MPGFNHIGPEGRDPLTGGENGQCGAERPNFEPDFTENDDYDSSRGQGRGFRRRLGLQARGRLRMGMNRNRRAIDNFSEEGRLELDPLIKEVEGLQRRLESLNKRLSRLEKKR